ncbi:UBA domain-containing protein Mud1-like [Ischnura elegans]|uniref:UBA domain-containing protein Mud1-like n=1 Tax=Ischnura elegans TaxID=197161 RepID=UPI001ED8B263|nr:UBA domain-containing protein Mud1-like [Ischnura elegans]
MVKGKRERLAPSTRRADTTGYAVSVEVGGSRATLLIDTGATLSLIREEVPRPNHPLHPPLTQLCGVTGHHLAITGTVTLPVRLGKGTFFHEFQVVGSDLRLPADGILGLDLLRTMEASLNLKTEVLRVGNEDFPLEAVVFGQDTGVVAREEERGRREKGENPQMCKISDAPRAPASPPVPAEEKVKGRRRRRQEPSPPLPPYCVVPGVEWDTGPPSRPPPPSLPTLSPPPHRYPPPQPRTGRADEGSVNKEG